MHVVEEPLPVVQQHRDVHIPSVREDLLAELGGALGRQGRAGQHDADLPAVLTDEVPEAPAEGLVKVGVSRTHAWVHAGHQTGSQSIGCLPFVPEGVDEVRSLPCKLRIELFTFLLAHAAKPGHMPAPELVLFDMRLLPRRIAHDHVEARPLAQEDLREADREVERLEGVEHLARGAVRLRVGKPRLDLLPLRHVHRQGLAGQPAGGHQIAKRRGRGDGLKRLLAGAPRPLQIGRRRVGEAAQARQVLGGLAEHVGRIDREQRQAPLLDLLLELAEPCHADQRVAMHQVWVRVSHADELRHLVKLREVSRLALGRQCAPDAWHVEGDVADVHWPAAVVVVLAHPHQLAFYCFVSMIVPESVTVQLNDAYVPVIRLPLTVALMVYGQSVGTDGESIPASDIPLAVPLKDPAAWIIRSG